jgi:hypothetical protein
MQDCTGKPTSIHSIGTKTCTIRGCAAPHEIASQADIFLCLLVHAHTSYYRIWFLAKQPNLRVKQAHCLPTYSSLHPPTKAVPGATGCDNNNKHSNPAEARSYCHIQHWQQLHISQQQLPLVRNNTAAAAPGASAAVTVSSPS